MRDAAYDAAEARGVTVGECVSESLAKGGDSFLELRIAAYRCVASLGRRPWFAAEVATSPKALALVTDPAYESTPPGCRWRTSRRACLRRRARREAWTRASVTAPRWAGGGGRGGPWERRRGPGRARVPSRRMTYSSFVLLYRSYVSQISLRGATREARG